MDDITYKIYKIAENGTTKISRKAWEYYDKDEANIVYRNGVFWYERGIPSQKIHEWTRKTIRKAYGKAVYLYDIPCPTNV